MKKLSIPMIAGLLAMLVLAGCGTLSFDPASDTAGALSIIPEPVKIVAGEGSFQLSAETALSAPAEAEALASLMRAEILSSTGIELNTSGTNEIELVLAAAPVAGDNEEGYTLNVSDDLVQISSSSVKGLFYGYQTLKQLLPAGAYGKMAAGQTLDVPAVSISDYPRFQWRGMHLDVGRHFFSVEEVKQFIDMLAIHKLNTMHWHLTEDQGWRIEIKKYPRLTEIGSTRPETVVGHHNNLPRKFDGQPYGGFYTQEEVREVVAYAATRHITVVPEIELPGHAQAAIAAYPEFGNGAEGVKPRTVWGISKNVYNVKDETIDFLKDVLTEVMALFPSEFIHIGGDECPKDQWKASEHAQQRIKEEGLADEHELQSWFIQTIEKFLSSNGRRLIGWDEILEGGLAPGATVMSWRGDKGGIAAAKMNHDVVMAPNHSTYFDHYQKSKSSEPLAIGGFTTLKDVYKWNPIPRALPLSKHKYILGGQAQLWTEYMKNFEHVTYMAFPRGSALAETLWTPIAKKNYSKFSYKMKKHRLRLANAGVAFAYPDCCLSSVNFTLDAGAKSVEIALPASKTGFYQLYVTNNSGDAIYTESAELMLNGKSADISIHNGYSGNFNQGSMYTLAAGSATQAGQAKVILLMKSENGKKASGTVEIRKLK